MNRSTHLSAPMVALSLVSSLALGCIAETGSPDETTDLEPTSQPVGHEHLMLTDQARAAQLAAEPAREARATPHLTYFGGPVLQSVRVTPVYWTSAVQFQSNLNAFYAAVTTSTFMGFFSQYNTTSPAQTIGAGSVTAAFVDNDTATRVRDSQIQTELSRLIGNGSIPAPTANSLYMVHFPAGVSITASDGSRSCVQFCAYHSTFTRNGVNVNYGVIPDQGGGCAGGCGANAQRVNNLTSVSSHEYSEAVTDPAVGLATVFGPPLGWYDMTNGEIGDICNAQQGSVTIAGTAWTVQKEWSNSANACVVP